MADINPKMVQERHMRESKSIMLRFGAGVGFIVLVVAAYFIGSYFLKGPALKSGVNPAPAGEITPYFPNDLNIEGITKSDTSYTYVSPDGKVTQPVLVYTSNLSMKDVLSKFRDYLNANGWTIIYDPKPGERLPHFYAVNRSRSVNVTLDEQFVGVKVSIAYATIQ